MATLAQNPVSLSPSIESQERAEAGSVPLRAAQLPKSTSKDVDVLNIVSTWVDSFNKIVSSSDIASIPKLFAENSYWRDHLCLSWDLHTLNGPKSISPFISRNDDGCRIKSISLDTSQSYKTPKVASLHYETQIIQAFLKVKTDVGKGVGLVRLVHQEDQWLAFTLFTTLEELNGFEEAVGNKRPNGVVHGAHRGRMNWLDRRKEEENFTKEDPAVLIVGSGQSGLIAAARIKMLGVKALIVDKNERIGDNWRSRYHQLVLHDNVWLDHMPYLPFPTHWPIFTPKDKLADWFESYAKSLELNVWLQTSLTGSTWDEKAKQWTVTVERDNGGKKEIRTLQPKHIIQATGHSGEPNFPSHIKGLDTFTGDLLCHSSKYPGAKDSGAGKKAIVVGCCNSGHDIAQDYHEHGYSVTMVQRSTTYVISADANLSTSAATYNEDIAVEDADTMFQSMPNAVLKSVNVDATVRTQALDADILRGLAAAGFRLDKGPGDAGLWIKYLQRGGGYYIDVGCSQLIAEGKIGIKAGCEIAEILPRGIRFEDGSEIEADEIVFATGYQNMRTQCRRIFGDAVADRVGDVWGFDEEGEIRTLWRKTGHPGFWFMAGNFSLCRYFSKRLALQIKALEEGLCTYEDL